MSALSEKVPRLRFGLVCIESAWHPFLPKGRNVQAQNFIGSPAPRGHQNCLPDVAAGANASIAVTAKRTGPLA
jgi:hypothetical protein